MTNVISFPPKAVPAPAAADSKPFSFDILQVHEGSGMMTVDGCLPIPVVMQLLKLLEPYAA